MARANTLDTEVVAYVTPQRKPNQHVDAYAWEGLASGVKGSLIGQSFGSQSAPALNPRTRLRKPPTERAPHTDSITSRSRDILDNDTPVKGKGKAGDIAEEQPPCRRRPPRTDRSVGRQISSGSRIPSEATTPAADFAASPLKRRRSSSVSEDMSTFEQPFYTSRDKSPSGVSLASDLRCGSEPDSAGTVTSFQVSLDRPDESSTGSKRLSKPQTTHDSIKRLLLTRLRQPKNGKSTYGHVYILRDVARPGKLKIGYSEEPTRRQSQIKYKCGVRLLEEVENEQLPVEHAERAEKLIHRELADREVDEDCRCGENHREWFKISEPDAKLIVNKWVEFIRSKPYDENGELKGFWRERLNVTSRRFGRDDLDISERHRRWETFTKITQRELLEYEVQLWLRASRPVGSGLLKWRWQVLAAAEAAMLYWFTWKDWAFGLVIIVSTCFICEVLHSEGKSVK